MRQLSALMVRREPGLLTPLPELLPWSETRLLIVAFNRYIDRLRVMISRQERFSADASHQLKTPLAVLKTQASVALASDDPQLWRESLQAMRATLDIRSVNGAPAAAGDHKTAGAGVCGD
jgi:two-component system sensor histidine kinase TctE